MRGAHTDGLAVRHFGADDGDAAWAAQQGLQLPAPIHLTRAWSVRALAPPAASSSFHHRSVVLARNGASWAPVGLPALCPMLRPAQGQDAGLAHTEVAVRWPSLEKASISWTQQ